MRFAFARLRINVQHLAWFLMMLDRCAAMMCTRLARCCDIWDIILTPAMTCQFDMYELIITNENLGPKEDAGLNQSLILDLICDPSTAIVSRRGPLTRKDYCRD